MSKLRIILACVLLPLFGMAIYFGWRYFFDPAGISIADGEICAGNESNKDLIFSVEASPGAKIVAFVEKGDRLCAPSSISKPRGMILVGESEDALKCTYQLDGPERMPFISEYFSEGKCDWGFVSR